MIIGQLLPGKAQRHAPALARLKVYFLKGAQLFNRLEHRAVRIASGIELHNLRSRAAAGILHRQRSLNPIRLLRYRQVAVSEAGIGQAVPKGIADPLRRFVIEAVAHEDVFPVDLDLPPPKRFAKGDIPGASHPGFAELAAGIGLAKEQAARRLTAALAGQRHGQHRRNPPGKGQLHRRAAKKHQHDPLARLGQRLDEGDLIGRQPEIPAVIALALI